MKGKGKFLLLGLLAVAFAATRLKGGKKEGPTAPGSAPAPSASAAFAGFPFDGFLGLVAPAGTAEPALIGRNPFYLQDELNPPPVVEVPATRPVEVEDPAVAKRAAFEADRSMLASLKLKGVIASERGGTVRLGALTLSRGDRIPGTSLILESVGRSRAVFTGHGRKIEVPIILSEAPQAPIKVDQKKP
jgi:hypothetical protein